MTFSKTENIKISVIVPIYNSEKFLKKCLDSIVNQSLKELEIILVDDGSTDNSYHMCDEYRNRDPRIILIQQSNQKQGAARNRGIEIANGKYIGFVDADDYVDLNFFEKLYNSTEKYDADIALASLKKVSDQKEKYKWHFQTEKILITDHEKFIDGKQIKNAAPYNKIYRKSLLDKLSLRFAENVFYEDGLFTTKAVYYSNKIVIVPGTNYYYLKNPNSTVNSKQTEKHKIDALTAKQQLLSFVRTNKLKLPKNAFHYTKKVYRLFNLPILAVKENVSHRIFYLFKIFPVFFSSVK